MKPSKPKSKSDVDFVATKGSKPGAVKRAQAADAKQDRADAKRFGVKLKKGG